MRLLSTTLLSTSFIVVASLCSGCGESNQTPPPESPTPSANFGESLEDHAWQGWHTYSDDMVRLNIWTYIQLLEYRDGLWCGMLTYDFDVPGSYFAWWDGNQWQVLVDVQPGDQTSYGGMLARVYGTVSTGTTGSALLGWMDSIDDQTIPSPEQTPPILQGTEDFSLWRDDSDWSLNIDPSVVTVGELMDMISDASEQLRTTSSDPYSLQVDMTEYRLPYDTEVWSGWEDVYCVWCMEEGDDHPTPTPIPYP